VPDKQKEDKDENLLDKESSYGNRATFKSKSLLAFYIGQPAKIRGWLK
jgi:hypothetical protein